MTSATIRFEDGAAYERYMGRWSRLVGVAFLDWLAPEPKRRWLDVGCGNGAFTDLIVERCAPASVDGVDPAEAQLDFARSRFGTGVARFHQGDAMALPFAAGSFDAAVMPLVIFFVPDPKKGVAEMKRVVRPGGTVAAYGWDLLGGGSPYHALQDEMRAMGLTVGAPPHPGASQMETLRELWTTNGLISVETRAITVQRTFTGFDDFWTTALGGPSVNKGLSALTPGQSSLLKARVQTRLPPDAAGKITCTGWAHAIKGRVPS